MIDFSSATWASIREYAEERLQLAREKNDNHGLSDIETATLRGEIRVWKSLIAMPEDFAARQMLPDDDIA